jgi:putative tryptophan/tyrosine transport system substrate-binding protein
MKRREFMIGVGGAAAGTVCPRAARSQRGTGMRKVAVLMVAAENLPDSQARIAAFRQEFTDLGWKDGENVHIEYRWAAGMGDLVRRYAQELVALAPDVILANSTPAVEALKTLTDSTPIVFALALDPVGLGLVKSLSRPGGNITGFTFIDPELIAKWMELIKEAAPGVARSALLFNPAGHSFYYRFADRIQSARQPGATELVAMPAGTAGEMETAINGLAQKPGSSLMVASGPFNQVRIKQIAQLAWQNRLPAISVYRPFAFEGGLMAYGPNTADIFRRSAAYVDRILRGTTAGELPVQRPDKFEFSINLKAAQSLGLTIPPSLLARADEVIE